MNTQNIKVFHPPPRPTLQVAKFLGKIYQFEFLVMRAKHFCLKTFFAVKYYVKIAPPAEKVTPLAHQPSH